MATEVSIVNAAFVLIGEPRISSLGDAKKSARIANDTYADHRDFVLCEHPWSFALKRENLAASASTPVWEFDHAYPLPADCLVPMRVKNEHPTDGRWKLEGREIVTDLDAPLPLLYVRQVTNPEEMTPQFRQLLSQYLAWQWADDIRGSTDKAAEMKRDYHDLLDEVRSQDSRPGTEDPVIANEWIKARLGFGTGIDELDFKFTPGSL